MGLELTQSLDASELAEAFESQPDELFEVLGNMILNADVFEASRVDWTLLFIEQFVPDATATKGGRALMSDVASLLEQMSVALKASVASAEAHLTVVR